MLAVRLVLCRTALCIIFLWCLFIYCCPCCCFCVYCLCIVELKRVRCNCNVKSVSPSERQNLKERFLFVLFCNEWILYLTFCFTIYFFSDTFIAIFFSTLSCCVYECLHTLLLSFTVLYHCICWQTNGQNGLNKQQNRSPILVVFYAYLMPLAVPLHFELFLVKIWNIHIFAFGQVSVCVCVFFSVSLFSCWCLRGNNRFAFTLMEKSTI